MNTARLFVGTGFPSAPLLAAAPTRGDTGSILATRISSRRRAATAESIVSAMCSPWTRSPVRVLPVKAYVVITQILIISDVAGA